uniref:TNFR-Cys domain-containing protein n=1 Tax=Scleropages formosus TaxID=113540 RepID=A0A8C9W1H6_SCLFO
TSLFIHLFSFQMWMIFLLTVPYSPSSACGRAQYEINGRCCTKCKPGKSHCNKSAIFFCISPTDLVKECKPSADTVCGALEGNYCIDPYEGGCRAAQKHTTCKPGHFIKHPGTEYNDTVCENCTGNYFSNGSSLSCTPHTR